MLFPTMSDSEIGGEPAINGLLPVTSNSESGQADRLEGVRGYVGTGRGSIPGILYSFFLFDFVERGVEGLGLRWGRGWLS